MRPAIALLCFASLTAVEGVYQAASPEPTAEETLILEFINRCRADPTADSLRIAPPGGEPRLPSSTSIDFAMFRSEMAAIKPSAPLVFDLRYLDAARKHSHYMILHGLGHDESPDKPGYTGRSHSDRLKAAGAPGSGGENCFRDAGNPWGSHVGFIIDWGAGGSGGMQAGRGHRANITNAGYTVIGVGALPHSGRLSVTHNLGSVRKRFAGGVVYLDKDRDRFYSLGEGRGAVEIAVGGAKAVTWASGAYAIEIPGGASTLVMRSGGVEVSRPIPDGNANIKLDWIIPQEQDLAAADKLLAAVDAAKDPLAPANRKALVALLIGAELLSLDDARAARVKTLTGELGSSLAADRQAVRAALEGEAKAFKAALAEHAKPWKGTAAAAWFTEAELYVRLSAGWSAVPEDTPPTRLRAIAKELRAAADGSVVGEFRARFAALASSAETRAGSPARGR